MADSSLDAGSDYDPEEARRAAQMAAMQRALGPMGPQAPGVGNNPVGPTGPQGPGSSPGSGMVGPNPDASDRNASAGFASNYSAPPPSDSGSVGPVGPQSPNVVERALNGGSMSQPPQLGPDAVARMTAGAAVGGGSYTAPPANQPSAIPPSTYVPPSGPATSQPQPPSGPQPLTPQQVADAAKGAKVGGGSYSGPTGTGTGTGTAQPPAGLGANTGTGQPPAAPSGATSGQITGGGDLGSLTNNIVSQIQSLGQSLTAPGTSADVSAMYVRSAQGILDMLNQQEASLRSDYEKSGTTLDPATLFTIDQLKQQLEKNLTGVREDLNRRGLYDSGIELQLENGLQKGAASDQAQLLGQRMSKLQDQLNQGLQSIRTQKVSTASQFGLAGLNAQNSSDQNMRTLASQRDEAALQGMLGLRGQESTSQNAALQRAYEAQQADLGRTFTGQQNDLSRSATAANDEANRQNALKIAAMQRALGTNGGVTNANLGTNVATGNVAFNDTAHSSAQDALRDNFDLTDPQGAAAAADFIKKNAATIAKNGADPNRLLQDVQGDIFGAGSDYNTGQYGRR